MSTLTTTLRWSAQSHANLLAVPERFKHVQRPGLTPEVLALLQQETKTPAFALGDYPPELRDRLTRLAQTANKVGTDTIECPACNGRQMVCKVASGIVTGVEVLWPVDCPCKKYRAYFKAWRGAIPEHYRSVTWSSLAPTADSKLVRLSVERQQKIIDFIKAHPGDSYLLYGTYRSGKTHISVALHQYHLQKWVTESWGVRESWDKVYRPVMRANMTELLDQHHALKTQREGDRTPRPSIDLARINDIAAQGDKPVLILDEIDKLGGQPTPFKIETILALVDKVHQHDGVVIATSNRTPEWFVETWGEEIGGPTIDRICGRGDKAHKIRFEERRQ